MRAPQPRPYQDVGHVGAWLSARLRVAGRRRPACPGRTGITPRWEPRLRLRRQPGLGLGPGPPGMALRSSKGDGSAGSWNRGTGKAGTEGDGQGPRSGPGLRGAAADEEPGLAPAAARHVRRAGCLW